MRLRIVIFYSLYAAGCAIWIAGCPWGALGVLIAAGAVGFSMS